MSARDDYPWLASEADDYTEICSALDEIDQLRAELDRCQLADIEYRNPGIDMDKVREHRAMLKANAAIQAEAMNEIDQRDRSET